MIAFDPEICNSCGLCKKSCPFGAIEITPDGASATESCTLCGSCVTVCPQGAVTIQRKTVSKEELAAYKGVMVVAECEPIKDCLTPKPVVHELLSKGRELADKLGQDLMVVVLGAGDFGDLSLLGCRGADLVLKCGHPLLETFTPDGFCSVLSSLIADIKPSVVLYGATPEGRELAPRVAARMHLGLTADCTGLDIDAEDQLVQTRPAFGGNIMAAIVSPRNRPQTATVRPNVFPASFSDPKKRARVKEVDVVLSKASIRTRVVETISLSDSCGPSLEEAEIIVAVGRGCCRPHELDMAGNLADKLGGILAGTRPLVEDGLLPHTCQVGQSGNTVGPKLYIALGISGAVQHLVGMSASETVIAVNKDPRAPIFSLADLGIVGNVSEVLPSLLEEVEGLMARQTVTA